MSKSLQEELQYTPQQHMLVEKWAPVLDAKELGEVTDMHRRVTTATLLENQSKELLKEDATTTQNIAGFNPVLMSMVRRNAPKLIAYDICGVQAMTMPTGLVFAMRARYTNKDGDEALFDKVKVNHSGKKGADDTTYNDGTVNPFLTSGGLTEDIAGQGQVTHTAEMDDDWNSMSATVEKVLVEAKTRQLRADYSLELEQDWKAVHNMDANAELSNILGQEILIEKNQEIVRTIYRIAVPGAQGTTADGTFDMKADSDGRWAVERYKGLIYQINKDANRIAIDTRRGRGNFVITSADVASALQMAGILDFAPALANMTSMNVDVTGTTYAGNIGSLRVYIDPYLQHDGYAVGYKGNNQYDAGLIYAPYVELQPARAVDSKTFHNAIGFKTRYGLVANPLTKLEQDKNVYYRKAAVKF